MFEQEELCQVRHVHPDVMRTALEQMPDEPTLQALTELYKVFGDGTRVKILCLLLHSEMCVCDLAQALNMSQSAISHQLRVLKQSRLVNYRRAGKEVFYSLADEHVGMIVAQGLDHVLE